MKKFVTLLICLLVVLSMTACGSKAATVSKTKEDSNKQTEAPIDNGDSNTATGDASRTAATPEAGGTEAASNNGQNSTTDNTAAKPNGTSSSAGSTPSSSTGSTPGSTTAQTQTPAATPTPTPTPAPAPKPPTVTVTIPEGYSISEIGDKLAAAKVCTKADFLKAVTTYDFNYYSLVAQIPSNPNRTFKLEGYLFPNTYEFNLNKPAQDAVGVFLREAQKKIAGKYSYSGMTLDQIITLASIIEKETPNTAEMAKISSVYHNRLNQKMRLQADPTIYYIERYVKPIIAGDYGNYYNTYKCPALPAGPICNPGTAALNAAVHPADTKYLYFVTDNTGKIYYAETYDQHKANCALAGVTPGQANTPSAQ